MIYTIIFKDSARKEFYALPDKLLKRIGEAIEKLALNPRPTGVKKLKGRNEFLWRIPSRRLQGCLFNSGHNKNREHQAYRT